MNEPIDRHALVARHDVHRTAAHPLEPLTVGNGEFAYTVDVTGLQTLNAFHAEGMPLGTHAQWAWHTAPNPHGYTLDDAYEDYSVNGRPVPYLTTSKQDDAAEWLRANPHRVHLGRIGFVRPDGGRIDVDEIHAVDQRLDLWQGRIESSFVVDGANVRVLTTCHPDLDLLAIRAWSSAFARGGLAISVQFPYAVGDWSYPCDWESEPRHRTELDVDGRRADIRRVLDDDVHHVALAWSEGSRLDRIGPHELLLRTDASVVELVIGFGSSPLPASLPDGHSTLRAAAQHWARFWISGGAIELAGSSDPRAVELERRVVLSQYLTAVNCAGSTPPAETGLVTNSWRGKFHLEMHWWHAAHFALWNRAELLRRSMAWYERILPAGLEYAARQGYGGARWPKQIGPEARESPSDVGAFLIWQQPHPIFYAELLHRAGAGSESLADLVFRTAEFMASYPVRNPRTGRFDLGPPLTSAQEKAFRQRTESKNPAFELAYWAWGLRTAQRWRDRLDLPPVPEWDDVASGLAELPIRDGRYVELEHPVTGPEGHPTMVGALGFVPDIGRVDPAVMRATLRHVLADWELPDTWGWDYPLLAMTAARLGEPSLAMDALLMDSPKNGYLANGHNFQKLPQLPLYLPGNGGLLYATAMMAGGWTGHGTPPDQPAPGFPDQGWTVRAEALHPAP